MSKSFSNSIAGFRIFRVSRNGQSYALTSMYSASDWQPGSNQAVCIPRGMRPQKHAVPGRDCQCGLQAYNDLGKSIVEPSAFESFAIALVAGSGRVQIHARGWRAERAAVIAIAMPSYVSRSRHEVREAEKIQEELARVYQVPLIRDSEEFRRFNQSIPGLESSYQLGLAKKRSKIKEFSGIGNESVMNELAYNFNHLCVSPSEGNSLGGNPFRSVSFIDLMFNREIVAFDNEPAINSLDTDYAPSRAKIYWSNLTDQEQQRLHFYQKVSWPGIHIAMLVCLLLVIFSVSELAAGLPLAAAATIVFILISALAAGVFLFAYLQHQKVLARIRTRSGF